MPANIFIILTIAESISKASKDSGDEQQKKADSDDEKDKSDANDKEQGICTPYTWNGSWVENEAKDVMTPAFQKNHIKYNADHSLAKAACECVAERRVKGLPPNEPANPTL